MDFALDVGAISQEERETYWSKCWDAPGETVSAQRHHQLTEEPTTQFVALLTAAISSGRAHLADRGTGLKPTDPDHWGWKEEAIGMSDGWQSQGTLIGWLDADDIYLEPETAYAVVQKFARDQNDALPLTKDTVWKRLKEAGMLKSWEKGKNLARVTIRGTEDTFFIYQETRSSLPTQNQGEQGQWGRMSLMTQVLGPTIWPRN